MPMYVLDIRKYRKEIKLRIKVDIYIYVQNYIFYSFSNDTGNSFTYLPLGVVLGKVEVIGVP